MSTYIHHVKFNSKSKQINKIWTFMYYKNCDKLLSYKTILEKRYFIKNIFARIKILHTF